MDTSQQSPRENQKRVHSGISSRLNRPFKSPMVRATASTSVKEPSPGTPVSSKRTVLSKRERCDITSPHSTAEGTPLHRGSNLKRARLSLKSKPSVEVLLQRETELDREIAELQSQGLTVGELDRQIDLLHRYNDIKDVAQTVMGRLAELESDNVIDLIFAVDNPEEFHRANLEMNPKHYSSLKYLGTHSLTSFQEHWGARVYFNTLVPYEYGVLKYGVISSSSLIADLLDWEWLYISGRLHKPVLPLVVPEVVSPLRSALQVNLQSALHAALILLPEMFHEEMLYRTIAGLSYSGDFRMTIGEDRNKVNNIVRPQMDKFRDLYSPLWPSLAAWAEFNTTTGRCEQDTSPSARLFHLNLLPKKLQQTIVSKWNRDGRWQDVEDVFRAAAYDTECPEIVKEAVHKIVKSSSWSQSLKNIPTAGIIKSVKYSFAKLKKMWKSLKMGS